MTELDEAILALLQLAWLLLQELWRLLQALIESWAEFTQLIWQDLIQKSGPFEWALSVVFLIVMTFILSNSLWSVRAWFHYIWVFIVDLLLEVWPVSEYILRLPLEIFCHLPNTPQYTVWLWQRRSFYLWPFKFVIVFCKHFLDNLVLVMTHDTDGDELTPLDWNPYIDPRWLLGKMLPIIIYPMDVFKKKPKKKKRKLGIDAAAKERILAAQTSTVHGDSASKSKGHARVDSGVEL